MINNLGVIDRIVRVFLAVVLIVLYMTGQITGLAAIILGVIAIIFVLTSMAGFCPLYHIFGISTKEKDGRLK